MFFSCCCEREHDGLDVIPIDALVPDGKKKESGSFSGQQKNDKGWSKASNSSIGPLALGIGLTAIIGLACMSHITLSTATVAIMFGALTWSFVLPRHPPAAEEPTPPVDAATASKSILTIPDSDKALWAEMRRQLCGNVWEAVEAANTEAAGAMSGAGGLGDFRDCSTPGKCKCLARVIRPPNVLAQLTVVADLVMKGMRLVTTSGGNVYGAIHMMLEPETWPEWVLLCERADILHRFGPDEVLCVLYMKLPIVNLRVEVMLYIKWFDRLDGDGRCGAILAGGDRIAHVAQLVGLPVPKPIDHGWSVVKANLDYVQVSIDPVEETRHMRFLVSVEETCPMDWMVRYIWGMIAARLMGILSSKVEARMEQKRGSTMDKTAAKARLSFFCDIEQRIAGLVRRGKELGGNNNKKASTS